MKNIVSRGFRVALSSLLVLSPIVQTSLVSAIPAPQIEGSFMTTVVSTGQVGRGEIKARATIQLGDANGSMPFFDGPNATNTCGARYSYFLGTNQTVIYDCVSPTYTSAAARSNGNFILVDAYSRNPPVGGFGPDVYTLRTPTELASAIAALGTNGDYSLSANGRQITYTRIAPETDPNGSTISPVQLSHGAQYLYHDTYASSRGYPAIPNLYSQVDFTPANVGSGETYEMTISVYIRDQFSLGYNLFDTKTYTATGTTVDDITSRIVAEYNTILYPIPSDPNWVVPLRAHPAITCVDNTTKITCTSNDYSVSIVGSSRVIYSNPDTTAPIVVLLGNASPETVAIGGTYTEMGASWTDNRDGSGTITTPTSGTVDTAVAGDYTLVYTKTDAANNSTSVSRVVRVTDLTNPVVTIVGTSPMTHELGTTFTDLGATWTDDRDGTGTVNTVTGINTLTTLGQKTLTYTYSDTAGNLGSASRIVDVVDTTDPVITLTPSRNSVNANAVSVNADVYKIMGTVLDASTVAVTISGVSGSPVTATVTPTSDPKSFAFTGFVNLTQDTVNNFTITATDVINRTSTSTLVITEGNSVNNFLGAQAVTGSDVVNIATPKSGESIQATTLLTFNTPSTFNGRSNVGATIPAGAQVTNANNTPFDGSRIDFFQTKVPFFANGAIEFGISGISDEGGSSGVPLHFSKPVKIEIPVGSFSGSTIPVKVKHAGDTLYNTRGLTATASDTCNTGIPANPSNLATVVNNVATIYTCAASTFAAIGEGSNGGDDDEGGGDKEVVVITGGGGGGGGSAIRYGCADPKALNYVPKTVNRPSQCKYKKKRVLQTSIKKNQNPIIETTVTPSNTLTCDMIIYLTKPVRLGRKNNPEDVKLLEKFLNTYEGYNIPVDGIYSQSDFDIVVKWQEKYLKDILTPWGITKGTGYVFTTSLKKIKEIHEKGCQKALLKNT